MTAVSASATAVLTGAALVILFASAPGAGSALMDHRGSMAANGLNELTVAHVFRDTDKNATRGVAEDSGNATSSVEGDDKNLSSRTSRAQNLDSEDEDEEEAEEDSGDELDTEEEEIIDTVMANTKDVDGGEGDSVEGKKRGKAKGKMKGGGGKRKQKKGMMQKLLPMFIIPFMVQSMMVPMVLATLKMMLLKTLFVGKLALILIGLNALKRNDVDTSYSSRRVVQSGGADLAMAHYGYNGNEEYGAYVNRRSQWKKR